MTVTVEFSGELEERLGTRGTYLRADGETVSELVDRLAAQFDSSVRNSLLTDERLRRGSVAVRRSAVASEPLSPESRVSSGDRVQFRI